MRTYLHNTVAHRGNSTAGLVIVALVLDGVK